jgi:hypothetical protein
MRIRPRDKLYELAGWNMIKLAEKLDMQPSVIYRLRHGQMGAGGDTIARALIAFPEYKFEDLFYIEGDNGKKP